VEPEYNFTHSKYQWVNRFEDQFATETFDVRYVFGELSQETISANIRLNWIFSPALSLQLYIQPLFAIGDYNRFKELARPSSMDYKFYGEKGYEINYNSEDDEYEVDPDGSGPAEVFTFSNPDFNFKSLRGNLVLRWEYLPGSVFYFVWTHNKINEDNPGEFSFSRDFSNLWNSDPDNVFLIKFSYWLDI